MEDYNPTVKRKVLDDKIADMESNKKISPFVPDFFLGERKRKIPHIFVSESYLKVRKTIRLKVKQTKSAKSFV